MALLARTTIALLVYSGTPASALTGTFAESPASGRRQADSQRRTCIAEVGRSTPNGDAKRRDEVGANSLPHDGFSCYCALGEAFANTCKVCRKR